VKVQKPAIKRQMELDLFSYRFVALREIRKQS
jgi:predicted unusual protein kinase regulating ubiquinone biosynthesis (AarF/ABC1/UbiB family)